MYDRQVRRRRAVLFALVACCFVLLTAYFGESVGGPLKSVQTGTMEVLAPIQEGANSALKPLRDLFGWFGDTLDAKSERDDLEAERDALRTRVAELQAQAGENDRLRDLVEYGRNGGLAAYAPVTARVYSRSNSSWYSTLDDQQGLERRRAAQPARDQRQGPRRQGQGRLRRQRGRDAADRLRLRRLGAGHDRPPARLDHARGRLDRRPGARPRARGQGRARGATPSSPRAPSRRGCLPRSHPTSRSAGCSGSRATASSTARSTSSRSPTSATSTSCRC